MSFAHQMVEAPELRADLGRVVGRQWVYRYTGVSFLQVLPHGVSFLRLTHGPCIQHAPQAMLLRLKLSGAAERLNEVRGKRAVGAWISLRKSHNTLLSHTIMRDLLHTER